MDNLPVKPKQNTHEDAQQCATTPPRIHKIPKMKLFTWKLTCDEMHAVSRGEPLILSTGMPTVSTSLPSTSFSSN